MMNLRGVALICFALFAAGPAWAVPRPFVAFFEFGVDDDSLGLPTSLVQLNGIANVTNQNSNGVLSWEIPSLILSTELTPQAATFPAAYPITGVGGHLGPNGFGDFVRGTDGIRGQFPVGGVYRFCLFGGGGCANPAANLSVPLSVAGVTTTRTGMGPVNFTVKGAGWESHQNATGNTFSLVTPVFISTNIAAQPTLPFLMKMTITFAETVPEPATIALLGGGVAALGAWRARSRR